MEVVGQQHPGIDRECLEDGFMRIKLGETWGLAVARFILELVRETRLEELAHRAAKVH